MNRRLALLLPAALITTGCSTPTLVTGTAPVPPSPTAVQTAATVPPVPASPAAGLVATLPAAGSLADAVLPGDHAAVQLNVAFSGLPVGAPRAGRTTVVYPWLVVVAEPGGPLLVHVKLPAFDCPADRAHQTRSACRSRRVQYADADARSAVVHRTPGGLVLDLTALPYAYGPGVDRGRARTLTAVPGGPVRLHVVVQAGPPLPGASGRSRTRPLARVTGLGALGTAAPQDDGYANMLVLR